MIYFIWDKEKKTHVKSDVVSESSPVAYFNPWVERFGRLAKPGERGLGDTIARIFSKFGGNKFKWAAKRLGVNCGCEDRQKYLNERYPYTTE